VTRDELPHARRTSAFETAWRELRARVRGPLGCLFLLLCLPFALLALLLLLGYTLWKGRRLRRGMQSRVAGARDAVHAAPVALFVRTFAGDASFTREEAVQAAVPAAGGRSAAELLAEAERIGWIEDAGDGRLAVTDAGRRETDELLRRQGL
jgi:hypothetical protein